jgi:hypothetical protein
MGGELELCGLRVEVVTLESVNYPGRYVSRTEGRVELLSFEDTPDFRSRATWSLGQL